LHANLLILGRIAEKLKWDASLRATASMLNLRIFENPGGMQRTIPLHQEGAAAEFSSLKCLHAGAEKMIR